jgi:hypothetical protein
MNDITPNASPVPTITQPPNHPQPYRNGSGSMAE